MVGGNRRTADARRLMWEERYSASGGYLFGTEPAAVLAENPWVIRDGATALCVADGEGRNSVHLARHGMQVTAFDPSAYGDRTGRDTCGRCGCFGRCPCVRLGRMGLVTAIRHGRGDLYSIRRPSRFAHASSAICSLRCAVAGVSCFTATGLNKSDAGPVGRRLSKTCIPRRSCARPLPGGRLNAVLSMSATNDPAVRMWG